MILLNDDDFEYVKKNGHGKVKCIEYTSIIQSAKQNSYVLFTSKDGKVILKRFWIYAHEMVEYTSDFNVNNKDIVLELLCSIMYETIMWIRNNAHSSRSLFLGRAVYPITDTKEHIILLEKCVAFLIGETNKTAFIHVVESIKHLDYEAQMIKSIIMTYDFKPIEKDDHINCIIAAMDSMKMDLFNKRRRDMVSRTAYDIHNEPIAILRINGELY